MAKYFVEHLRANGAPNPRPPQADTSIEVDQPVDDYGREVEIQEPQDPDLSVFFGGTGPEEDPQMQQAIAEEGVMHKPSGEDMAWANQQRLDRGFQISVQLLASSVLLPRDIKNLKHFTQDPVRDLTLENIVRNCKIYKGGLKTYK